MRPISNFLKIVTSLYETGQALPQRCVLPMLSTKKHFLLLDIILLKLTRGRRRRTL